MSEPESTPPGYHPKWAEIERRMMGIEEMSDVMKEMIADLRRKQDIHEAVCVERQKTIFNTMASLDTRIESGLSNIGAKISDLMRQLVTYQHDVNDKLSGYQGKIITALCGLVITLVAYMWTHKMF